MCVSMAELHNSPMHLGQGNPRYNMNRLREAEKLVRYIRLPWKDLRSILYLNSPCCLVPMLAFILHLKITLIKILSGNP